MVWDTTSQQFMVCVATNTWASTGPGGGTGAGTVTSVALSAPPIFTVGGSPISTAGTLALTFANGQTANTFLAAPNGSAGPLGLRLIVAADLPASLTSSTTGNAATATALASTPSICSLGSAPRGILATGAATGCAVISGGGGGAVTSVGLTMPSVFAVAGSPVTTSGTLAATFAGGQTANSFLATPNGVAGALGLRTIVAADLPATITSSTTGNAAALATLPSTCTAGMAATGISTNGNAVGCFTPSSTLTPPLVIDQASNGQNVITMHRFTDTAPTGNLFQWLTAGGLVGAAIDANYNVTANSLTLPSGAGLLTAPEGSSSYTPTAGVDALQIGDSSRHCITISLGILASKCLPTVPDTPTVHGVVLASTQYPQLNTTGAGLSGQCLTSNGASADPTYQTCPGGAGTVTSVTGTAGQIASTGGTTPVLSITSPFLPPGNVDIQSNALAQEAATSAGTYVVGDLACITASNTVGDCPSVAANSNNIGVLLAKNGTAPVYTSTGTAPVNSAMSLVFTQGDFVCSDSLNAAKVIDNGAVQCGGSNVQVGTVKITDGAGSFSHTVILTTNTGGSTGALPTINAGSCGKLLDNSGSGAVWFGPTFFIDGICYAQTNAGLALALTAANSSGGTIIIPQAVQVLLTANQIVSGNNVTIRCEAGGGFTAGASLTAHGMIQVTGTLDRILDCTWLPGSFAGSYPIQLNGNTQAIIEGNIANGFTNSNGVFVQLQDNSGTPATENVIRKNFCSQGASGGACVAGYGSSTNNRVVDNDFSGGIIFHSNTTGKAVSGNQAIGNRLLNGIGSGFCIEVGDFGGDSPDGWMAADNYCKLFGSGTHGGYSFVNLQGAVSVTGNTFRANGFTFNNAALEMGTMTNGATATGNHLYGDGTRACIELDGNDSNVVVTGNDLNNCGIYDGSSIASSTLNDAIINNNQVTWTGNHNLIWVQANGATLNVNGAQICGNTLKGDATSGSIGIKIEADSGGSANGTLICPNVFDSIDTAIGNYGGTLTIIKAQQFLGTVNNQLTIGTGGTVMSIVPMPFGKLPACVAGLNGNEANLSDSNTAVTYNSAVTAGSGSTKIHVVCQGTSWVMQ